MSVAESPAESRGKCVAALLLALAGAFSLRVAGQVLVVAAHPAWLPPTEQWYSGLVPYSVLLPMQLALLGLMIAIVRDVSAGQGRFATSRPRLGAFLTRASYVYAAAMVVRYGARMWLLPDQRWIGGTIPIVFHLVLATFMYVWGREQRVRHHAGAQRASE